MAAQLKSPEARKLLKEFEERLNLEPVEAHRATFVVLALNRGWRHARIARYLGVTRHRIGQRASRYEQYASSGGFPQLTKMLDGEKSEPSRNSEIHVSFKSSDWSDLMLARELIDRVC